jgi:hypothetical protein
MNKPKFTYFDVNGGRGESTRLVALVGGYEMEDNRIGDM